MGSLGVVNRGGIIEEHFLAHDELLVLFLTLGGRIVQERILYHNLLIGLFLNLFDS